MARTIKNSQINAEKVDSHDAYNRAQFRRQDVVKDREDPQVGPLENRSRASRRRVSGADTR